jgi:hypothetical protein
MTPSEPLRCLQLFSDKTALSTGYAINLTAPARGLLRFIREY